MANGGHPPSGEDIRDFMAKCFPDVGGMPNKGQLTGVMGYYGTVYDPKPAKCLSPHPQHTSTLCELPKGHGGPLHMHKFEETSHTPEQVYCWLVKDHSLDPLPPEPEPPLIVIDLEDYGD